MQEMTFENWWKDDNIKKITNKAVSNYSRQMHHEDIRQTAALCLLKALRNYNPRNPRKQTLPGFFWYILRNELASEWRRIKKEKGVDNRQKPVYNISWLDDSYNFLNIDLSFLPVADKVLLESKYYQNKTLQEIANEHGCSVEWIRRKIERVLDKIRSKLIKPVGV
jgi:RNA polymerase sigma factor (sigma-70 family)